MHPSWCSRSVIGGRVLFIEYQVMDSTRAIRAHDLRWLTRRDSVSSSSSIGWSASVGLRDHLVRRAWRGSVAVDDEVCMGIVALGATQPNECVLERRPWWLTVAAADDGGRR